MAPTPAPPVDKKVEKGYFSSAVDSMNPWAGSRSTTPTPKEPGSSSTTPPLPSASGPNTAPGYHTTSHVYGQSLKRYPPDCPPLKVMWFHAVDIPKRKPKFLQSKKNAAEENKPPPAPKKLIAFSPEDSKSLETTYQTILEDTERDRGTTAERHRSRSSRRPILGSDETRSRALSRGDAQKPRHHVVYVQEDFLFQVDLEERELSPVYWLGPVYDVRRGTWFYQEGSTLRPCEENLAAQLEEGYLKVKPWLYPARVRSDSGTGNSLTPKPSTDNLRAASAAQGEATSKQSAIPAPLQAQHQPQTHRLFGTYMNSVATYQDTSVAWLTSDSVLSWVTSTVYERFAGGGYMSGVKLVRGFSESNKEPTKAKDKESKDAKDEKWPSTPGPGTVTHLTLDEKQQKLLKRRSAPPATKLGALADTSSLEVESQESRLQRQISSLMDGGEKDRAQEEEEVRKREEKQMQTDYNPQVGEKQGRDIDHVFLVTHGIGQLLGLRMESVNFVHDVNILRKNLKSVYASSADLKALNSESDEGPGNCRIQVLPVCWRHLLDFPKKKEKKREQDLGETYTEEDEYPSLEDITVEGVAFARSLISDLALDVLLYQSAYREQIAHIVLQESNRVYNLFMERNPEFTGKVHIIGHSLGSAIMFDILCRQKETPRSLDVGRNALRFWTPQDRPGPSKDPRELKFDFDVEDLYCLGSPIGLFQMLKGRTISARHLPHALPSESPLDPDSIDDPFLAANAGQRVSSITGLPYSISSPKLGQLFNIFHPSDPIAYRMEPLITPAMSSLKSQILPYTKKGIFGSVAPQGITGIGVKVGQSVSGLWSSLSAGIASNILNRSLGLTQEDVANMSAQQPTPSSSAAGTNSGGGVISDGQSQAEKAAERKKQLARSSMGERQESFSGNDVTLLDDELETLYSNFESRRVKNKDAWQEEEDKARRLRREEMKVRALNRNGRVDYSIQESALDFNPMNTIASHMAYWSDEDVAHFIMSQALSNRTLSVKR
ncbi:hypothetical protein RB595_009307 [Gaeumannomyces hyphopodioides]